MEEQENELFNSLAADPNIQAAIADHNAACDSDDESNCVVCNFKKALGSLMFIVTALDHSSQCDDEDCDAVTELDIAMSTIDSLEGALAIISACQTGIKLLADVSTAAAFIIHEEELVDDDEDEFE